MCVPLFSCAIIGPVLLSYPRPKVGIELGITASYAPMDTPCVGILVGVLIDAG
jgi:hypothetical protein